LTNELSQLAPNDRRDNQRLVMGISPNGEIRNLQPGDEPIAELVYVNGSPMIRNLGGSLPVFVDEVECRGHIALRNGQVIRIGDRRWAINSLPDPMKASTSATSPHGLAISLRGVDYAVQVGWNPIKLKKTLMLLRGIDIDIKPGEFVGIVGPSGSGKSTLIRVLNGDYSPSGQIVFNHCKAEDFLRTSSHKMAYLPQELILHDPLTARAALTYSAELRGIPNPKEMVAQVLQQVGMTERADVVIHNLSGGQKKRIALASELLNKPDALFLDEATSGLDPASEREMMLLFRQLSDSGITTVCITHFPGHLTLCDRLLVVNHGVLVCDGTPQEVLEHFHIQSIDEIYAVLQSRSTEEPLSRNMPPLPVVSDEKKTKAAGGLIDEVQNSGLQLPTLLRRYVRLFLSDTKNVAFLLLQAPIIAAIIGLTFGNIVIDFAEQHASDWKQVAFLLLLSIIWCSSTNGVREIVKEKHIYLHERRYRLNSAAYLLSKFILLGIIGITQAWIMLAVLVLITGLDTGLFTSLATITSVALVGTAIGLAISTVAKTSEQAVTILPIIVIAQAVYSGGLARMTGLNQIAAMVFASSFWGLESLKTALSITLINATFPGAPGHYQPPILGRPYPLSVDLVAIAIQMLIILYISLVLLSRRRVK